MADQVRLHFHCIVVSTDDVAVATHAAHVVLIALARGEDAERRATQAVQSRSGGCLGLRWRAVRAE